ncbi:hypothetical protein DFH06DRAFT_293927 [Mycena polygramma]|nr:hypothetical protein DFH06DRAFT_293927 [Mycena polygramma]
MHPSLQVAKSPEPDPPSEVLAFAPYDAPMHFPHVRRQSVQPPAPQPSKLANKRDADEEGLKTDVARFKLLAQQDALVEPRAPIISQSEGGKEEEGEYRPAAQSPETYAEVQMRARNAGNTRAIDSVRVKKEVKEEEEGGNWNVTSETDLEDGEIKEEAYQPSALLLEVFAQGQDAMRARRDLRVRSEVAVKQEQEEATVGAVKTENVYVPSQALQDIFSRGQETLRERRAAMKSAATELRVEPENITQRLSVNPEPSDAPMPRGPPRNDDTSLREGDSSPTESAVQSVSAVSMFTTGTSKQSFVQLLSLLISFPVDVSSAMLPYTCRLKISPAVIVIGCHSTIVPRTLWTMDFPPGVTPGIRDDGFWGPHEYSLLPQLFCVDSPYMAWIPLEYDGLDVLRFLSQFQFALGPASTHFKPNLAWRRRGTVDPAVLAMFQADVNVVYTEVLTGIDVVKSRPDLSHIRLPLGAVERTYASLLALRVNFLTRQDVLEYAACLKRSMAELQGFILWSRELDVWMDPSSSIFDRAGRRLRGAVCEDMLSYESLHRMGVPAWCFVTGLPPAANVVSNSFDDGVSSVWSKCAMPNNKAHYFYPPLVDDRRTFELAARGYALRRDKLRRDTGYRKDLEEMDRLYDKLNKERQEAVVMMPGQTSCFFCFEGVSDRRDLYVRHVQDGASEYRPRTCCCRALRRFLGAIYWHNDL